MFSVMCVNLSAGGSLSHDRPGKRPICVTLPTAKGIHTSPSARLILTDNQRQLQLRVHIRRHFNRILTSIRSFPLIKNYKSFELKFKSLPFMLQSVKKDQF